MPDAQATCYLYRDQTLHSTAFLFQFIHVLPPVYAHPTTAHLPHCPDNCDSVVPPPYPSDHFSLFLSRCEIHGDQSCLRRRARWPGCGITLFSLLGTTGLPTCVRNLSVSISEATLISYARMVRISDGCIVSLLQ